MTAEVQFQAFTGATSGSFTNNVGVGNTVYLFVFSYTTTGSTISSSAPEFNGNPVIGAVKLYEEQSTGAGSNQVYEACWRLPDLPGGAKGVSITVTNGNIDSNVGIAALEVSGMGATPSLDTATPNPEAANGSSGTVNSGLTGAITNAGDIIVGSAVIFGAAPSGPSGFTNVIVGSTDFCVAGYKIPGSSGGTYEYDTGSTASAGWTAGVAAETPTASGTPHTTTASLTVTPQFTVDTAQTHAHTTTASLTVTPQSTVKHSGGYVPPPGGSDDMPLILRMIGLG